FTSLLMIILIGRFFLQYSNMPKSITQVTIGTTTVEVEVADTDASRERGLSYRDVLLLGHGMLFVFQIPGTYGFWMKDMHFPLDIIFADSNGIIVTIERDATPESYEKDPPDVFYPASPISYVLEVP